MTATKSQILLESVLRFARRGAFGHIRRMLVKSHPSETAAVIRQVPEALAIEIMDRLRHSVPEPLVFAELGGHFLRSYLAEKKDLDHISKVLQLLPENDAANLISYLDENSQQSILATLKVSTQTEVHQILQYEENSCGRAMADVFSLSQDLTARQAIAAIQKSAHPESLFYLYVVDGFGNLTGVLSLKNLLQVDGEKALRDIMVREVVHVGAYEMRERAAEIVEKYGFVSLPVVDEHSKLVGMIAVDDVFDTLREEAQEDVLNLTGVDPQALEETPLSRSLLSQGVWYGMLLLGGLLSGEIILHFMGKYGMPVVELCLIPMVLRLGGSTAMQSVTLVQKGLLNPEVERSRALKVLWDQIWVTIFVVTVLSGILYLYGQYRFASLTQRVPYLSLGFLVVALFALVVGVALPLFFRLFKVDTLRFSSRFVHFLMDGLSLLVFFGFMFIGR